MIVIIDYLGAYWTGGSIESLWNQQGFVIGSIDLSLTMLTKQKQKIKKQHVTDKAKIQK